MLNGEGNENGIKIKISTLFFFFLRCFAQLQRCFVGIKRQTSQLYIIFNLWRNCRMCLSNVLFPVFFAFIFHCRSFSPCWPLAFLIRAIYTRKNKTRLT